MASESWLDTENIARSTPQMEWHPLRPFLPVGAKVLFLGSFPPQQKRWCIDFFYPNFINDHWRIEGEVFYGDKLHFVDTKARAFRLDAIVEHCQRQGIAFYDTSTAVRRLKDNASDKFLEVLVPTDIPQLVSQLPQLRAIVVTGEKAAQTVAASLGISQLPAVGAWVGIPGMANEQHVPIELYRLPSSSRAYPLALDAKAQAYKTMFRRYGYSVIRP